MPHVIEGRSAQSGTGFKNKLRNGASPSTYKGFAKQSVEMCCTLTVLDYQTRDRASRRCFV